MNDPEERLGNDLAQLAQRAPASRITTTDVLGRVQRRRRRRTAWRAAAACTVVAGVVVGVAAIVGRDTADPVAVHPDSPFVAANAPPLIALDAPGWRVERFDDSSRPPALATYIDRTLGFAGPWFVVERTTDGVPAGATVDVGGGIGGITGEGGFRMLVWTATDGVRYRAMSRDVPDDQLIAAAAALQVDLTGVTTTGAVPAGMTRAEPNADQLLNRYVEYQLTNGAAHLQVSFYSGGRLEVRTAGEARETIEFNGRSASLLDYSAEGAQGSYRLNVLDGFWVWELNGDGFADRNAFLDLASKVKVVDETTWKASLPAGVITDDNRPSALAEILVGVPLPPDFPVKSIPTSASDPYQLTAQVTGVVFCAWLHEWFVALDNGHTAEADAAVQAIASSHDWPALVSMTGGDWDAVLWDVADRVVQGDRAVVDDAVKGLGCPA
jgi:hypothetical protein